MADQDALVAHEITHRYSKRGPLVLKGVSFTARRGEIVGLIGQSGAGKSTLLRCINGLITPTSGTLLTLGLNVAHLPESARRTVRRRVGMIFQEFNLLDRLTVMKNVLVGRIGYLSTFRSCLHLFPSSDRKKAAECLAMVGLAGFERRRARDLSGGQKQRVAIARAIAQGAEIILGDEATANLDARTTDAIMEILVMLARERNTLVFLSIHDLDIARRYCNRVLGLRGGTLVFDAHPDTLSKDVVEEILK
jgi:phosphonate transport system ATP-binding protein